MCSKEGRRIVLWMCWVVNMLVTSLYYYLSFATAHNLVRSFRQLEITLSSEVWRAPIAAAVLGGCLLLFFNLLSCAVLAKKSVDNDGPGFGYGFVAAMCVWLAFFALLCGLVLDGFKEIVRSELQVKLPGTWTEISTGVYVATIAFAYLCFVMLLLFFFALVVFQSAVTAELGLPPLLAGGGIGGPAPSPTFRNPFAAHQAKYEAANNPYGAGGSAGYESPQGPRIPAVRMGPGGGGGGGMQASASLLPPPQPPLQAMAMAMPTPMPGAPLAMQQDSAI